MSKGKKIALWSVLSVFIVLAAGVVLLLHTYGRMIHAHGLAGIGQTIHDVHETTLAPKEGFPGQDKLTILCMGIDDNWTNSDVVYTAQARTDTLFVLTLDLNTKKATMLSIPRDTNAHIAGTNRYFKINSAYETGGPERAIATVNELLNIRADHFMVLNIDATKKMVDALGGVDVDVAHEMHYHDKWGHLSIDLQPGQQHLDGDHAVGFARYRHPDLGKKPSPEDGDDRRIYRQHTLLRAMVVKAKNFANVTQAPHLVDVGMSSIRTDLTRQQLFDLAAIFKGIQQEDIRTAMLPGDDYRDDKGAWLYRVNSDVAHAYADWLVKGDEIAARKIVPVIVKNGTDTPGLAQHAVALLKLQGYTDVRNGGNVLPSKTHGAKVHMADTPTGAAGETARTTLLDLGVANPDAPQDIALLLGVSSPVTARHPLKPNRVGWTPPAAVLVTLGQDYAAAAKASGALNADIPPSSDGANAVKDSAPTSAN